MTLWKLPPRAKIYEALSAIGDGRVALYKENAASVMSSGGDKNYTVQWSGDITKIVSNDNASFWQGYLGYPILAVLMELGKVAFDQDVARQLKGVRWNKINKKFKRDYDKAIDYVMAQLEASGLSRERIDAEVDKIMKQLEESSFERLPTRLTPPRS